MRSKRLTQGLAFSVITSVLGLHAVAAHADASATRVTNKSTLSKPTEVPVITETSPAPGELTKQDQLFLQRITLRQTQIWNALRVRKSNELSEGLSSTDNQRWNIVHEALEPYNQGVRAISPSSFINIVEPNNRRELKPLQEIETLLSTNAVELSNFLQAEIADGESKGRDVSVARANLGYLQTTMFEFGTRRVGGTAKKPITETTVAIKQSYKKALGLYTPKQFKDEFKNSMPAGWTPQAVVVSYDVEEVARNLEAAKLAAAERAIVRAQEKAADERAKREADAKAAREAARQQRAAAPKTAQ